jgi:SAM-dependent methyltransferase
VDVVGLTPASPDRCHVCGGTTFAQSAVLWRELVDEWELQPDEVRYIDVQQGTRCTACGSNVRSIALALAITRARGFGGTLSAFVDDPGQRDLRVLEVNEAGDLHPVLRRLPRLDLRNYPECDMRQLPFERGSYDLIVHSDTLEHVEDPLRALGECRRVLDERGLLAFTVPVIVGRLSRDRKGMPESHHGHRESGDPGMIVHSEFGADVWTFVLRAGFSSCELVPFCFPAGLAVVCRT